ncbi:phosphotransferase [Oceanobacillus kimchii]|uniref:phosphotransferase n=1 Tax=Oceanobacillus kimchii TaxID=746691 RepID=UPI002AA2B2E8|nr:phosphotransferase [Oceanobacillus kimchii]
MTSKIIFGSKRLGEVKNSQLQSMLDKYDLGKLLTSSKTEHGAMGQTMFVTSTKGNFVLKGNPLYPGQLVEEKFFIDNIDNRTNVKVPKLYIIDDSNDIFGWNYAIIQRLEGKHLNSKELEDNLHVEEKLKIAELIGQALSSMHNWKVNMFGELDTVSLKIVPF